MVMTGVARSGGRLRHDDRVYASRVCMCVDMAVCAWGGVDGGWRWRYGVARYMTWRGRKPKEPRAGAGAHTSRAGARVRGAVVGAVVFRYGTELRVTYTTYVNCAL